jgi:HAMP domain-containing protein
MRFMTKENISEVQRNVHQWMTIIGFPVLIVLVGDMYIDFKNVRNNDIRQDERLTRHKEEIQELKSSVETMGNYVWRGVK